MHLGQSGERLLHFGSLLQGIVMVKTKLVEPRSTESKIFSLWFQLQWVLSDEDCCITNLKVHRFHPALSKKVLLGVAVSVLRKKSQLQNISMPLTWVQRCWRQAEAASQPWPHSWQATFPLDALCNLIVLRFLLQENFFLYWIYQLPNMKDSLRLMSWDMHPYSPTPIVEDYETFNITLDQSRLWWWC